MNTPRYENSIPSLNLDGLNAIGDDRAAFLWSLRDAARQVGFFYLTGHGIEQAVLDGLMKSARRFFALPARDKMAVDMVNSPHFRGYTRLAWERTRSCHSAVRALVDNTRNLSDQEDHIDYIVKRIGIDHVGIGTDFNHGAGIIAFDDESEAPNVTIELVRRGYTEAQIAKIWGGNFLRVFSEVEAVAGTVRRP